MKTPEQILDQKFSGEVKLRIAGPTVWQRGLIIAAMQEYAKEAEDKLREEYEQKLIDASHADADEIEGLKYTLKSLVEDNRALKEAIEINCNCNADGCHQAKLLQDKDYEIQEAWEKVHALEDDLHNSEYQNTLLAQKLTDINSTVERLDNELTEAVEIMSSIYHSVDKYHLSISFKNGVLFDKLKDYLGK